MRLLLNTLASGPPHVVNPPPQTPRALRGVPIKVTDLGPAPSYFWRQKAHEQALVWAGFRPRDCASKRARRDTIQLKVSRGSRYIMIEDLPKVPNRYVLSALIVLFSSSINSKLMYLWTYCVPHCERDLQGPFGSVAPRLA